MIYNRFGDVDKAIDFTERVLKINPNDTYAMNNIGYYYLVKKEYDKSCKWLQKSLKINPKQEGTNGNLGNCLFEMGKYDEAVMHLEKSLSIEIELKHSDIGPKVLENYGKILNMKQDYKKSNEIFMKLIERDEFNKHGKKDEIYYLICKNYHELKQYKDALEFGLKATTLKPDHKKYTQTVEKIKQKM